ncbi:hypothetical protein [Moorena producens]|uniref:hypothetical protein n=1 Tax=Moorena producens TaxID=1155739 RepID=UPI0011EA708E|nr:hypothetical protein [Moorena producens]
MGKSQGIGKREQGTGKKLCVPHYYEKRYSHVGCVIRRKASDFPPLRAWDRPSPNAPPVYSLLPTPYSLLPLL